MIDYTMPVLSEQERNVLIDECEIGIATLKNVALKHCDECEVDGIKRSILTYKIALAALTAKPVSYKDSLGCFVTPRKGEALLNSGEATYPLFMASPVTVIKQEGEQ